MSVTWTDDSPGSGAVEYRLPGQAAKSTPSTSASTGTSELKTTYSARLTGLTPSTPYEYRVQSGGAWSPWTTFRTAPPTGGCGPVRFAVGGDSRGEVLPLVGYVTSAQWKDVAASIISEAPQFLLHTGDIVYNGDAASEWAKELPILAPLSSTIPFFMNIGNHDNGPGQGAGAYYNALFNTPANGTDAVDDYYSFVVGNVLVVGLSTYSFSMDTQIAWLQSVLEAHRTDVDWRIVTLHTPVWSSGAHGNNENDKTRASLLVPVLDAHKVDLVLHGHDHDFERFHPSRGGYGGIPRTHTPLPLDQGRRGQAAGTVYMVSGGAGALVNPLFSATGPQSAFGSAKLHYLMVDVTPGKLTVSVRDCGGQSLGGAASCSGQLDWVTLEKSSSLCENAPKPDAGQPDAGTSVDAGPAGPAGFDAGLSTDAGTRPDAGAGFDAGALPARDAGTVATLDAGEASTPVAATANPPETTAPVKGCGCSATGFAPFALLTGLLGLRRRARR